MIERRSFTPFIQNTWETIRDFIVRPSYSEVYREREGGFIVKENYKGEKLIGQVLAAEPIFPRQYLEYDVPPFIKGRCIVIGGGDYKTVIVEEDSSSDSVIKIYNWCAYRGEQAEEQARAAARKITIIHEISNEFYPGIVLPYEMIVAKTGNRIWWVYERQQRAENVALDLLDPKTAERLKKEALRIAIVGTKRVEEELIKRGLTTKSFGMITDDFALTQIEWDLKTQHLVSLDIVDQVDVRPLLDKSTISF